MNWETNKRNKHKDNIQETSKGNGKCRCDKKEREKQRVQREKQKIIYVLCGL
jgi:DUF4097 and DUF4098 domain-containing protein YvlB